MITWYASSAPTTTAVNGIMDGPFPANVSNCKPWDGASFTLGNKRSGLPVNLVGFTPQHSSLYAVVESVKWMMSAGVMETISYTIIQTKNDTFQSPFLISLIYASLTIKTKH